MINKPRNRNALWPRSIVAVCAFIFCSLLMSCGNDSSAGGEEPFRMAMSGKYPPFSYFDENGDLAGFDVDVSHAIAEKLGREAEPITTEWSGIIAGLQSGRYDAIIGSMGVTPERQEKVLFSEPYYISGAQLFIKAEDADKFKSIEDMKGYSIGAGIGSTYQLYVEEHYPEITVRSYPREQDIFEDMKAGRLEGFVTDKLVGMWNAKNTGTDFIPVGDLLYDERIAIPTTKENIELNKQINDALAEMEADGTMAELKEKWFALPQEVVSVPNSLVLRKLRLGLWVTVKAAVVSIVLGFLISIPFGVGIKSAPQPIRGILKMINEFIRGTPMLVQLFFVYHALPKIILNTTGYHFAEDFTPFMAGTLTLMINCSAYMAEVVRSGLISVPQGQTTASMALGMSRFQAFRFVVWPQAFRVMIPPLMNSVVATMKDTALLSVISVAEVLNEAQKLIAVTYDPTKFYLYVAILYFIISYPLMKAAQRLEDNIRKKGFQENA